MKALSEGEDNDLRDTDSAKWWRQKADYRGLKEGMGENKAGAANAGNLSKVYTVKSEYRPNSGAYKKFKLVQGIRD